MVNLYHAISRPGFAIEENRAEAPANVQRRSFNDCQAAYKAQDWEIFPELQAFRAKHKQLLEGVLKPDSFTHVPTALSPVCREDNAYGVLGYTHLECCNEVLKAIGSAAIITFSTCKLLYK